MLFVIINCGSSGFTQNINDIITVHEAKRIEYTLASDEMKGRLAGTPEIELATNFIETEFKKIGLQPFNGSSYIQEFTMVKPKLLSISVQLNQRMALPKDVFVLTNEQNLRVDEKSGYEEQYIKAGDNFFHKYMSAVNDNKNLIVYTDTSFAKYIDFFNQNSRQIFKRNTNVIFILNKGGIQSFTIKTKHNFQETKLKNVIGVLPGKTLKNQYLIFSGHYDHLGIGKSVNNDSIYNGANDDASGITAVILLAKYYKSLQDNERSIIFAAFTAEEEGEFGSEYFSRQIKPAQVTAMNNIEMIGTQSKWGRNSAFITGYDKSNMGTIIQSNLKGTGFDFYPDPYTQEDLFFRSDNATLARLGVPAHTISTSKMDSEPNYHQPSDEISTLDMENMTEVIKAIAIGSATLVNGKDTPSRILNDQLN
ncbi:MAG: hypothetical protein NVS1B13_06120 [Flavisolibacter sp.]